MTTPSFWKAICNQRLAYITLLGFFSGLPLALSGSTLQAWLTEANVDLMSIGILSMAFFPYTFKFLWAPLLDRFQVGGLSRRRGWIICVQVVMSFILVYMAFTNPASSLVSIGVAAILLALFSATQDVAIDAYRADTLLAEERGIGVASFIFAYRMAMFASGGLALVLASYWGWKTTYLLMAGMMLVGALVTYSAPEKTLPPEPKERSTFFYLQPFLDLWRRENIIAIIAFVILYKAGAALSVALLTNFLIKGVGFTLLEIGMVSKVVIIVGSLIGGFVGGYFLWRLGVYASLFWFGLAQAFSILAFVLLAVAGKNLALMIFALFIENFCSGLSSAALVAFLMSLCSARYSASQYAFLSAIDTVFRLISGPLAAALVLYSGWVSYFGWSFVISFPALFILFTLRKRVSFDAKVLQAV